MRIGVYGGTFDPVHHGHLVLAEQVREQLRLDEVWWIPCQVSPHKTERPLTAGKLRFEMLQLAVAGHAAFRALSVEIDRPGPSFTVETLSTLVAANPGHEWWLLLGADSLQDFPLWREPGQIVELARIAAVNRGGTSFSGVDDFRQRFGDRADVVQMPGLDIAASDLRQRVAAGRSIRYLTPRAVEAYIAQHGLYRDLVE
jgi:nicotinate-nucleotide adenylyltransferase